MQHSSKFMAQPRLRDYLLALGATIALTVPLLSTTAAQAQNLDLGKNAPRLFADTCAACHRTPRGLARGRGNFTLSLFLKEHYSTSSNTASELAAYLVALDTPDSSRTRPARPPRPAKPRPPAQAPAQPN